MPRFLRFGFSRDDERALEEEMRLHLELETERLVAAGAAPAAARAQARRRFGNAALAAEDSRAAWGLPPVDTWLRDAALAVRSFRRSPVLTAVAVLSLALGIGANGAAFALVDAVLLRDLPVAAPEELVLLRWSSARFPTVQGSGWLDRDEATGAWTSTSLPEPLFRELARSSRTLSEVVAFADLERLGVGVGERAERLAGQAVSGGFFGMLGLEPALGRAIQPADDRPGAPPVVVLDHAYWRGRMGGRPQVLGEILRLNGEPFTIVGVAPRDFAGTLQLGTLPAVYLPLAHQPLVAAGGSALDDPYRWWLQILGRRAPGADLAAVDAEIGQRFAGWWAEVPPAPDAGPDWNREIAVGAEPGRRGVVEMRRTLARPVVLLQSLVALVLVIACVNVGNLLLARAAARRHEIATRLSLGAGRVRLVRQLLTESAVLALAGGALGIGFAAWLPPLLASSLPAMSGSFELPPAFGLRVAGFSLAVALLCGLLFGLGPALRATRAGLGTLLGQRRPTGGSGRLGRGLVGLQVALSLLVVAAAALLAGSLWNLQREELGFRDEGILLVDVDPAAVGFDEERRAAFYTRAIDDLAALPGVRRAALARHGLLSGRSSITQLALLGDGEPTSPGELWTLAASEGFFATMDIPLLAGRSFGPGDREGGARVALLNREAVERYFDGVAPIGRIIGFGLEDPEPVEVVGVVGDALYDRVANGVPPTAYVPWRQAQGMMGSATFILHVDGPPMAMERPVREELARLAPDLPVFSARSQRQQIDEGLGESRRLAQVAAFFALLAVGLASIGLYGVTAYGVHRRRGEIGIRIALGAARRRVQWMVLRDAAATVAAGLALGLGGTLLAGRMLEGRLFGLTASDPVALAGAAAALAAVAAAAALLPARRAARLDPLEALRHD